MKRCLSIFAITLLGMLVLPACEKQEPTTAPPISTPDVSKDAKVSSVTLCSKCGQVKGTPVCCVEGAEKCSSCKLAKGSPACCKHFDFTAGSVLLCTSCGQVKGSEVCCKSDAEKCGKCSLAKGSPGCCKLES